jgi:hypothetical protein
MVDSPSSVVVVVVVVDVDDGIVDVVAMLCGEVGCNKKEVVMKVNAPCDTTH